ncbi:MAG: LAGLIDADG family homing endonuclease [Candidatus Hodarchaeota archaeon]
MPGIIKRIAGPVVFVYGLDDPRKNHVVEVGEEKLLGEIIQLRGDTSVIQVYEETSGIGINEPVYPLGRPLTVRLGPGIMSTVYDGIQRPLDLLKGSFIGRGEKTSPLQLDKKWHFVPDSGLTSGMKVQGGEILGRIQETESVEHRVLVPPNVRGTIKELVSEGDYSVTDTVVYLTRGSFDQKVPFYHDWPVRQPRPFKSRILSDKPYLTGQRILDFLFPLVDGGSAMIPGGFGTGKCVTGETPLLLSNGEIINIKDLYDNYKEQNGIIEVDTEIESLIKLMNQSEVISFNGKTFKNKKVTHIYRGKTNRIIEIKTKTGREIEITPVHKLHAFNGNEIIQVEASNLSLGDFIVIPRKMKIIGEEIAFNAYELDNSLRVVDEKAINEMIEVIEALTVEIDLKELAKRLNISYSTLRGYWSKRRKPTLSFLNNLSEYAKIPLISVQILKSEHQSKPFRLPEKMTPELAEWLGLFVADGHIKGEYGGIYLYNNSDQILDRFKELTKNLFNLSAQFGSESNDKTPFMKISNTTLIKFLYFLGIPRSGKTYNVGIPSCVLKSPEKILIHFLNGYITGDGSFSKYTLDFSTASNKLQINLSYLLSRLGVLFRKRKKNNSYAFYLEGKRSEELANAMISANVYPYIKLQPLYDYASKDIKHFDSLDIIPIDKELLTKIRSQGKDNGHDLFRKTEGIRLSNYIDKDENLTFSMLKRIFNIMDEHSRLFNSELLNEIKELLEICENVYFDKIIELNSVENVTDVYDVTVEDYHNFVGGDSPLLLHNTVLERTLAKFASTEIMQMTLCGERGNEAADALQSFMDLIDPKTGRLMIDRTSIIANTSNMPVAAREASIYMGITIAEFYRDQGYSVSVLADSTSRWAEALREISGRLGEIPGEEGFPSYLPKLIGQFYERSGRVITLNGSEGSITTIGAVSPQGGDFSEPVTQYTMRFTTSLWALDTDLARSRHFPAISWRISYSQNIRQVGDYLEKEISSDWNNLRAQISTILQEEEELERIVRLVGKDTLSESQKGLLLTAELIREGFLQQNAFSDEDAYSPAEKTYVMAKALLKAHELILNRVENEGLLIDPLYEEQLIEDIKRLRELPVEDIEAFSDDLPVKVDELGY